ncbi:MAG: M81 family metallopeptidase [Alphaproteobacteria bacterium]|jgi:microcystin degradation protein MlrC|nr:M81 family metallopeptidase [Alphaproteobacteria bacterium]
MRRFVTAVMRHETNTFSPVPTPLQAFSGRGADSGGPLAGEAAIASCRGTNTPAAAFIDLADEVGAELVMPISGSAHPSGTVDDSVIDVFAEAIVDGVRAGCEALFLDLHGGMVAAGFPDAEGELLRRIRAEFPDLPVAVAFDFHTNLSGLTVDNATVITGYRTYPHIDMYETGARAGRTLLRALDGKVAPVMVWHSLPILSHLNRQTPSRQPMKDIMDRAIRAEADGEVLNASVFGCFPLADIPNVGLSAIVIGDGDGGRAKALLDELMAMAWERRADFVFETEPVETSIAHAKTLGPEPIILADHGDVCGSGGTQDVMAVLSEVMRQGLTSVCAGPYYDPQAVATLIEAGIGAEVTLMLGGRTDMPAIDLTGKPLEVSGRVRCITDGRFTITGPMMTGITVDMGPTVVLDTGAIEIVISSERHEPFDIGCFTHAGINPAAKNFILIKSRQHFRAGFDAVTERVVMVSGPGITTSDYHLFPWDKVRRPVYPFDPDLEL